MVKLRDLVKQFGKAMKVATSQWGVTETRLMLLVSNIADRQHADQLQEFLAEQGLICAITVGDRRGTLWSLSARRAERLPHGQRTQDGPVDGDSPTPRRRRRRFRPKSPGQPRGPGRPRLTS